MFEPVCGEMFSCSVLQCVAVCCSVLQCVAVKKMFEPVCGEMFSCSVLLAGMTVLGLFYRWFSVVFSLGFFQLFEKSFLWVFFPSFFFIGLVCRPLL